ncbi:MAG: ABC transporter ATP-binding protein [Proteobacteria bacterium]|nr:ABC transporter ATP-binding protein [Pseudomonadota bacterium]
MNNVVEVKNISKIFKIHPVTRLKSLFKRGFKKETAQDFKALSEVSFTIEAGESVAIIGRNGSGKSTLLQIIAKIIKPSTGSLNINGRVAAILELGSGFNPEFTGAENIQINALLLGLSQKEVEGKFDDIVAFADIGEFIDQKIKNYSSGMTMRLAFAIMLHASPDILIIDEALAVGDIFFQQKCIHYLQKHFETKTKIFVTHDLNAVSSLCTRVLYLDKGILKFDGNTAAGIEWYLKDIHTAESTVPKQVSNRNLSDNKNWQPIPIEKLSGLFEIKIEGIKISVNQRPVQFPEAIVRFQDKIEIELMVYSNKANIKTVFGYLLADKYGTFIFGENSCVQNKTYLLPEPGYYVVYYQFNWPDVYQGQYTLTPGVGEGDHPLNHQIQCWANNIFIFNCLSSQPVHGLFNNPLTEFQIEKMDCVSL